MVIRLHWLHLRWTAGLDLDILCLFDLDLLFPFASVHAEVDLLCLGNCLCVKLAVGYYCL